MSGEYEVGYGKPPRHTRFQKGRSGNPRGRPKGTGNLFSDLEAELRQRITVREGEVTRRVSRQRAVLKRLLDKALKGELGAIVKLLELVARHDAMVATAAALAVNDEPAAPLSAEEREVLAALEARLLHRPEAVSPADAPPADERPPAGAGAEEPPP